MTSSPNQYRSNINESCSRSVWFFVCVAHPWQHRMVKKDNTVQSSKPVQNAGTMSESDCWCGKVATSCENNNNLSGCNSNTISSISNRRRENKSASQSVIWSISKRYYQQHQQQVVPVSMLAFLAGNSVIWRSRRKTKITDKQLVFGIGKARPVFFFFWFFFGFFSAWYFSPPRGFLFFFFVDFWNVFSPSWPISYMQLNISTRHSQTHKAYNYYLMFPQYFSTHPGTVIRSDYVQFVAFIWRFFLFYIFIFFWGNFAWF